DLELQVAGQCQRGDDADEDPADHAAEGDREVEEREMARPRASPRQLAVAEHADDEEPEAEDADLPEKLELQALVGEEPRHHAEHPDEEPQVRIAPVPLARCVPG